MSISTIYTIGIVKGWRLLHASTNDDYAKVAIEYDMFKEYYDRRPSPGVIYDPVPGTSSIMDHLIVESVGEIN